MSIPVLSTIVAAETPKTSKSKAAKSGGDAFAHIVRHAGHKPNDRHAKADAVKIGEADDAEKLPGNGAAEEKDAEFGNGLDRLLASVLSSMPATSIAPEPMPQAGKDAHAREDSGDETLNERIVITTALDLSDLDMTGEKARGGVSLEVLRMETHFEPQLDAKLVEQGSAGANEARADKKTIETTGAREPPNNALPKPVEDTGHDAVKPAFSETLQRLGNKTSGGEEGRSGHPNGGGSRMSDQVRTAATATAAEPTESKPAANLPFPAMSAQIAERIAAAFPSVDAPGRDTPTASTNGGQMLRMTAGGAALKTLSIQLQPQDLGRLDVSMRLIDGRLTLELAATEASTARALAQDRHGLRKLLEHAGFTVDEAAITIVTRDGTTLAPSPANASATNGGESKGEPQGGWGRNREQSGGSREQPSGGNYGREKPRPRHDRDGSANRAAGSIYL